MTDTNLKEVDFEKYCPLCVEADTDEVNDPCNECLDYGVNYETEKPVKYKEKTKWAPRCIPISRTMTSSESDLNLIGTI